jgi:uncharacterized protein (TIGR00251 family)
MKTRLSLKVRAGARKTGFAGRLGEAWKLHIAAPPVDGKANEAIIRYLSKLARVPASAVRIVTGHTGPSKIIEIEGVESAELERAILESHGHRPYPGSSPPPES